MFYFLHISWSISNQSHAHNKCPLYSWSKRIENSKLWFFIIAIKSINNSLFIRWIRLIFDLFRLSPAVKLVIWTTLSNWSKHLFLFKWQCPSIPKRLIAKLIRRIQYVLFIVALVVPEPIIWLKGSTQSLFMFFLNQKRTHFTIAHFRLWFHQWIEHDK